MKYLSITQTAERWGISTRRIQILCAEGRVPGAIRIGTVWGIPDDEPKPADARIRSGKYIKKPSDNDAALARMLFILCTHAIGSAAFRLSVTRNKRFHVLPTPTVPNGENK